MIARTTKAELANGYQGAIIAAMIATLTTAVPEAQGAVMEHEMCRTPGTANELRHLQTA
jgi:hypothetical protein